MVARKTNGNGKAMTETVMTNDELDALEKEHLGDAELKTGIYAEESIAETQEMGLYDTPSSTKENYFLKLRQVDVGEFIEKKNNLSYLSWAYAVDLLYQHDPDANYEFLEPTVYPDGSMMVWCKLTAFGKVTTQYLPVMDYKNKAVCNPNSMDINKAMQRCLATAIAVGTGVGLYIYRGEDIPVDDNVNNSEKEDKRKKLMDDYVVKFTNTTSLNDLKTVYTQAVKAFSNNLPQDLETLKNECKQQLLAKETKSKAE
jgi:hypothetical protein